MKTGDVCCYFFQELFIIPFAFRNTKAQDYVYKTSTFQTVFMAMKLGLFEGRP